MVQPWEITPTARTSAATSGPRSVSVFWHWLASLCSLTSNPPAMYLHTFSLNPITSLQNYASSVNPRSHMTASPQPGPLHVLVSPWLAPAHTVCPGTHHDMCVWPSHYTSTCHRTPQLGVCTLLSLASEEKNITHIWRNNGWLLTKPKKQLGHPSTQNQQVIPKFQFKMAFSETLL